ncbi:uncharacterized protein LOC125431141 isoform X2 [Sphaerodactylus townsendi]|uniref:uncharacterized protein LOC125431141 isoform X2 n=1 Tax=Sphaerodactylus townsendi TaxID=933632 RepID=UPI002026432E|nr:uncharacterized protein LOC125431141 isoform X2 [Sphaerodactylus townsendi]
MQSLQERHGLQISCMNLEKEDDLGPAQGHRNSTSQQNEILHLPRIHSLVNSAQEGNGNIQQELFSLKIRNCTVFKAVPLPHIGNKMAPCLSDSGSRAGHAKQFLGLLFSPEKDVFEKIFSHFDSSAAAGWQRKAHGFMSDLGAWSCSGDTFVQFAHFWLSELQHHQKLQLLELEMGIIEDKLRLALLQGSDSREAQPLDFNVILAAVLSEYPSGLVSGQSSYVFLDYLNFMSSDQMPGYKKMLSSIQYPSKNPQIAQWLLAIRAFVLANLWHAVVKFYKALVNTQISSEQPAKSSVSSAKRQSYGMVKERALQSVQLGYTDVLDYLVRNQQLDLGVVDEKNRNLLFLAAVYDQSKVLDYFLEMTSLRNSGWSNQAAENGNTPLHAAVNTGKMHLVSLLLHYPGINVNVPNPQCDGATPLHLAIVYARSLLFAAERCHDEKALAEG